MDGGKRGVVEDRGGVIKRRRLLQGGRGGWVHSWCTHAWQRGHKGVSWLHGPVGGMHLYNM